MKLTTNPISTHCYTITLIAFLFITQVTSSPLPLPSLTPPQIHDSDTLHQRDQDPPPSGFRYISVPSINQNRPPRPPPPQVNYVPPGVTRVSSRPPIPPPPPRNPPGYYTDSWRTGSSESRYPYGVPPERNTVNASRPIPKYRTGEGPPPSRSSTFNANSKVNADSNAGGTKANVNTNLSGSGSTHPDPPPDPPAENKYKGTATHFARPPIGMDEETKKPGARRL